MTKRPDLTNYQRGIVNRYYEHRDSINSTKLSEIVSELYLCEDEKKAAKLWKSAATAIANLKANPARVEKIFAEKDLGALAKLAGELG